MSQLTPVTADLQNDVVSATALLVRLFAIRWWRIWHGKPGRARALQGFAVRASQTRDPDGDAIFRETAGHDDPQEGIRIAVFQSALAGIDCGLVPEIGWIAAAGRLE
jgi:hypothetical protein